MSIEKKRKVLTLVDEEIGPIVLQPNSIDKSQSNRVRYVLCPSKIQPDETDAILDWLSLSSAQIFCQKEDIKLFAEEGLSTHRFYELDSFQSIEVAGGSIEFFPSKEKRKNSSFLTMFFKRPFVQTFHVFVSPTHLRDPILYLASPHIRAIDVKYFLSRNPMLVGNPAYPMGVWHDLGHKLSVDIKTAEYQNVFESRRSEIWDPKKSFQEVKQKKGEESSMSLESFS